MWHPIRLAEDYAMADIVTNGRAIMGIGRGYHTREVETFGAPSLDTEANREMFEEQLQLLLRCFNEDAFRHKGKYYGCPPPIPYRGYQLEEITIVPRPKHLPVEIWMPIASGKTIDMMAKYGLKAMVTLNGEKILDDVVRGFHAACVRHGRATQLGHDMIWGQGSILPTARRRPCAASNPRTTSAISGLRLSVSCVMLTSRVGRGAPAGASARVPSLRDGVQQKAWFCGATVADHQRDQIDRGEISRAGGFL